MPTIRGSFRNVAVLQPLFLTCVLFAAPTSAHGQEECTVASTFLGFWYDVELICGTDAEGRRAGRVSEELRACPLLAGDRVAVSYENGDPRRGATVTRVTARGGTGGNAGDWCSRGFAPGLFTGPCELSDDPPVEQQTNTVGESSLRTTISTQFRDDGDGRASVSPGRCAPLSLEPGIWRVYVTETIRRGEWKPCPNDPRRACEAVTSETNRYEGGIYVDRGLERVESVRDVSAMVRGWSGAGESVASGTSATPWVTTSTIRMTGVGVAVPWVTTDGIRMTGVGVELPRVVTDTIKMTGTGGASLENR